MRDLESENALLRNQIQALLLQHEALIEQVARLLTTAASAGYLRLLSQVNKTPPSEMSRRDLDPTETHKENRS